MSLTGPAARLSFASRMPPGAPIISSALRILSVAGQNAGSEPNMESNWDKENLQRLLAGGWRPVRETAMGGSASLPSAFSLLVLEKETESGPAAGDTSD